jgi:hypothetical protein
LNDILNPQGLSCFYHIAPVALTVAVPLTPALTGSYFTGQAWIGRFNMPQVASALLLNQEGR